MPRLVLPFLLLLSLGAWGQQPRPLDLSEAVRLAVAYHVQPAVARERVRESEARIEQALADRLPQLRFTAGQNNQTLNLASLGFSSSVFPINPLVGPFYNFDSRINLLYNIIDAGAGWRLLSAQRAELVAQLEEQQAEQTVSTLAEVAYYNLLGAQHAEEAARADLQLAERLVTLARHQEEVGIAAGIDVTRAQARVSEQQLQVNRSENQTRTGALELARVTHLPLDTTFVLTDPPAKALPTLDEARREAAQHRLELAVLHAREYQLEAEISAADASDSPTLGLVGNYGLSGNTPTQNAFGTYLVGLNLTVPLFDGGRAEGKVDEMKSRLRQAQLNLADTELQVEQEVRAAMLRLDLARQQMATARTSRELADREYQMSVDRFEAGLATTVEVAQAFDVVVRARDAEVQAFNQFNLARVGLAASVGNPKAVLP